MDSTTSLISSKFIPQPLSRHPSLTFLRPFNKHVEYKRFRVKHSPLCCNSKLVRPYVGSSSSYSSYGVNFDGAIRFKPLPSRIVRQHRSIECSSSNFLAALDSSASNNPLLKSVKNLSFESLKSTVLQLNPVKIFKWGLILSLAIAASKWALNLLFNPFFWMYFSWTWLFWPWMVAISLAIYGLYSLRRYLEGESTPFHQLAIITSTITWLTLVPPAHFNGFLEGWPFVFFFVYHYFFFLNVSIRKRLYGDYYPRAHDPKWDIESPNWHKLLFFMGVMGCHFLAAFEGPELHLLPGGLTNVGIWILIALTVFMQYHASLYLAKYSEKVVVPTDVVRFGPYRFVRHPIYASTMLLFVTYFAALRAPISAVLVACVCSVYYGAKAKAEEGVMMESFGEKYGEYMNKVRYKLIPFVY